MDFERYSKMLLLFVFLLCSCSEGLQRYEKESNLPLKGKKEVLLIGTFHYNNPGADVAKTKSFDILSDDSQQELEHMASRIAAFKPTKIFVEWDHDEQVALDSLYDRYRQDMYFNNEGLSDFYRKNEIFQLAFRAARQGAVDTIIGMDYATEFPFDSLMLVIERNKQTDLQSKITEMIEVFTTNFDEKIENGESLLHLTYSLNTDELREMSNYFHTEIPLLAGSKDNFIGPFLSSEWYRRNLYMWSLIQKGTAENDARIMVLAGASHVAMFKKFIDDHPEWSVVELQSVMETP